MQDHQVSQLLGPGEVMYGTTLALDDAIARGRQVFPGLSICVVGNWFWIDLVQLRSSPLAWSDRHHRDATRCCQRIPGWEAGGLARACDRRDLPGRVGQEGLSLFSTPAHHDCSSTDSQGSPSPDREDKFVHLGTLVPS